jgi:glucose/arabinose dehydrogenase
MRIRWRWAPMEPFLSVRARLAGSMRWLTRMAMRRQIINMFIVASRLNSPNGVAFHEGSLYVAEIQRIIRFDNISTI